MISPSLKCKSGLLFLLLFACGAVYWGGLRGEIGFFHDDQVNLVENKALHVQEWDLDSFLGVLSSGFSGPLGRPLSMYSFALHYAFDKSEVFHFKLVNLLLHLVNGCLVFWLGVMLLSRLSPAHGTAEAGPRPDRLLAVFLAAGFWLLAPVHVTSVLYVVQRMNSLAAGFCLFGMCCYCLGRMRLHTGRRGWPWIMLGFCSVFPAALCKENGLLLPLFLFLIEVFFFRFAAAGRVRVPLHAAFAFFLYIPLLLLLFALLSWSPLLFEMYQYREFSPLERLLTEARVLVHDLRLLLLPGPHVFTMFQDIFKPSRGLLSPPSTLGALCFLAVVFGTAMYCARRAPILSFGILFFFCGHLMESTIIPLELFYDHRNYLPSVGLLFALGHYLARFCEQSAAPGKRRLFQALACLLLAAHVSISVHWVERWKTPILKSALYEVRNFESARAALELSYSAFRYHQLLRDQSEEIPLDGDRDELLQKYSKIAIHYADKIIEWKSNTGRINDKVWRITLHHRLRLPVREAWVDDLERTMAMEKLHVTLVRSMQPLFSCRVPEDPVSGTHTESGRVTGLEVEKSCALTGEQADRLWRAVSSNRDLFPPLRRSVAVSYSGYLWTKHGRTQEAYDLLWDELNHYPDSRLLTLALLQRHFLAGDRENAIRKLLEYYRSHPFRLPYWELDAFIKDLEESAVPSGAAMTPGHDPGPWSRGDRAGKLPEFRAGPS